MNDFSRLALVAFLFLLPAGSPQGARAAAPQPAFGTRGMVVVPQADAALAGLEMLEAGGNAVDAAVAAGFALAVTQPQSTGIGGGGFLLIHMADGSALALDARETAPAAAGPDLYTQPGVPEYASLVGGLAVGTPGLVAGFAMALELHGTLPLSQVMAPAIRLAEEGYVLGRYQTALTSRVAGRVPLERFPEVARIHFPNPPHQPGDRLVQADLANTLRRIASEGPAAFYAGPVAEAMAAASAQYGGILTVEDLAAYRPVARKPVTGSYRGHELIAFPPPSSGGVTLIEILNVLEGFDLRALGAGSSASIHRIAEAMKMAFAERAVYLGDPDFVEVPAEWLASKAHAAELRARINPARWRRAPWTWHRAEWVAKVEGAQQLPDDQGTAHLSVVDEAGNAVAITETVNGPYGSFVMVPGTGILLNNEMDDFVTHPGESNTYGLLGVAGANSIAPGKRPLSSMAPIIALQDGKVRFVAGSNGGPLIITSVLLTLLHQIDWDMNVSEAVSAPRFHHQWRPDVLRLEAAHPADVERGLRQRGHHVKRVDKLGSGVQAIAVDPETGTLSGAPDPRREGLAAGF